MNTPADTPLESPALREFAARGMIEQASDLAALDVAMRSGPVTFYVGFDPTAASLHVGNLVPIMAMRVLQRHGHRPIVVLGGGTGMVGDPSGKTEMRKILDAETLSTNRARIHEQFGRFLDVDAARGTIVDNADWLLPLGYIAFLRDVGVHFTVNRMIAAKTYRDRLEAEEPLSFIEFNYQLLQAYDFVHLFRTRGVTLQLGGADQWGNIVAGIELIRRMADGQGYALTFPLLTTADGRKMGKSEKGALWLDAGMCSPFDYYQYFVGVDDRDVRRMLMIFTDLGPAEIERMCQAEGAALREVKATLAFEATRLCHGLAAAETARTAAAQAFGGGDDWSAIEVVALPVTSMKLIDLVVDPAVAAFPSKRQARERIVGGGVKVDGESVTDPERELRAGDFADATLRLQAGKKLRKRILLGAG